MARILSQDVDTACNVVDSVMSLKEELGYDASEFLPGLVAAIATCALELGGDHQQALDEVADLLASIEDRA